MSDATDLAGGCLCGTIRYRSEGPVLSCGICNCATCRRAAGAESVAWLTVVRDDLHFWPYEPTFFSSSPRVERGFCAQCGTTLTWRREDGSGVDVTLASLDDPEAVQPSAEWWLDHRLSWNPANPRLTAFSQSGAATS